MVVSYWIDCFMSDKFTIITSNNDLLHQFNSIANELEHGIDKDNLISNGNDRNDNANKENQKNKEGATHEEM